MARVKVKPPARLERRPGDEELTIEQLKQISLFADLSRPVDLEQFPGTVLLQRFDKGEAICRQNEPGYTAFYILTTKDLMELRQSQRKALLSASELNQQRLKELNEEITRLRGTLAILGRLGPEYFPPVATANVDTPVLQETGLQNTLRQTLGGLMSMARLIPKRPPGTLVEGELFGEMSCLYRIPRTATVTAEREFYVLTFLRNILDKMYANKAFKDQLDSNYRKRILELHLRQLPLFQDLPADVFRRLRDRVELLPPLEPGDLICDEYDRPDGMYFVRSGFVKVAKNTSFLLGVDAIANWQTFAAALQAGEQEASGPKKRIWDLLKDDKLRAAVSKAATGAELANEEKHHILFGLNDLLKQPKLQANAEFKDLLKSPALAGMGKLPAGTKKWSQYQQVCQFNRQLLASIYPDAILPPNSAGSARVLDYRSPGDYFGEMGLVQNTPRTATCVAYVHHGEGKAIHGRVELVRVGKELFDEMMRFPEVQQKVTEKSAVRQSGTERVMSLPVWQETQGTALSVRFDDLGLIQGQKLMLIDLDRCTRCDKCVEACVKSHERHWWDRFRSPDSIEPSRDGRTRLFLDGPRFTVRDDKGEHHYLVPSTCRQCRDPICLVGCPVGSIHKDDNGQIVIEDWCIGCSRCAEQCPYGSIQMHQIGIVERGGRGWQLQLSKSGGWTEVPMPFKYTRDLRNGTGGANEISLRTTFQLDNDQCKQSKSFRLQFVSAAPQFTICFNGQSVVARQAGEKVQAGKEIEALLTLDSAGAAVETAPGESPPQPVLRRGHNMIEATLLPTANSEDVLLDLGVYAYTKPVVDPSMVGEFSQEVVAKKAVVCDMCGSQFGQQPACVNACPHEAAMRVDARAFFHLE